MKTNRNVMGITKPKKTVIDFNLRFPKKFKPVKKYPNSYPLKKCKNKTWKS